MTAAAPHATVEAAAPALAQLRAVADELGYGQLYGALAGGALFPADHAEALRAAHAFGGAAGATLRLLALGDRVALAGLDERLASLGEALAAVGLAAVDTAAGALRLVDLVAVPVLGGLLLTGTPPTFSTYEPSGGRAYLGEDSLRLARALPRVHGRHVLDLGSGCGVQGVLAAAGGATSVVCTDLEPRSVELSALNAVLNGHGTVEVRGGDAYAPVAGRRFDLVVTLPPYLPEPPGAPDAVVAAGPDGLGLLRRIVAGAADHLRPGGELVAFAQLLCDDAGPLLARELPGLAPTLTPRLVAFDQHPIEPFARELARFTAPGDPDGIATALLDGFDDLGVTGVCSAYLRLLLPASGQGARSVGSPGASAQPRRST